MVKYECENCKKEFVQKSHYDLHKNKKKSCKSKEISDTESKTNYKRVVDLFAGTGAFSLAFQESGYNTVFANDMVVPSQVIYELNFPEHKFLLKDLNDVEPQDIPEHDILCFGFPCQSFSIAGYQKGFNDQRANVFWKILEIIEHHLPSIFILENVKNLTSHDKGKTFEIISSNLEKKGYYLKYSILDTSKYTKIPHHRERIYLLGFRNKDDYNKFSFNFVEKTNDKIKDYLEDEIPDKYYYNDKYAVFEEIKSSVKKNIDENVLYQYRRHYVRENKSNQCPTLTANMGGGGHNVPLLLDNKGIRKLTPRECFNLQGFPSNYKLPGLSDSALYKLAGNAVSVPIVRLLVEQINHL